MKRVDQHLRAVTETYAKPHSPEWLARRIKDQKPERARALLRNWAHKDHYEHITLQAIQMLKNHDEENIIERIHAYTSPHNPTSKRSLHIISQVTTIDDRQTFTVPTLIDSGCTNSVIDRSLVDKYTLNTTPLPVPLDAAGADGRSQKVTHYVTLHINVK
ncbi:hypothetical protein SERLA73DRAFT_67545, partial [Serpula lacrymans var. lacrymans S7.3]